MLRQVLDGPLICPPFEDNSGVRIEGRGSYGKLLEEVIDGPPNVASPAGSDTLWTFERRRVVRAA